MVAQMVVDLYGSLSRPRLEAYRPTGGSDLDMVVNYFWNIDLAEAIVTCPPESGPRIMGVLGGVEPRGGRDAEEPVHR